MPSIKKSKSSRSRLNGQRKTKVNIMKGGAKIHQKGGLPVWNPQATAKPIERAINKNAIMLKKMSNNKVAHIDVGSANEKKEYKTQAQQNEWLKEAQARNEARRGMTGGAPFVKDWVSPNSSMFGNSYWSSQSHPKSTKANGPTPGRINTNRLKVFNKPQTRVGTEEQFKDELSRPRTGDTKLFKLVEAGKMKKPNPGNKIYPEYIGYNNDEATWKDEAIKRADEYLNSTNLDGKKSRYELLKLAKGRMNYNLNKTRSTLEEKYRAKYTSPWGTYNAARNIRNRNNAFDPLYNFSRKQMRYIREHPEEWIQYVKDKIQPASFRDGERKRLVKAFFEGKDLGEEFTTAIGRLSNNRISQGGRDFNKHLSAKRPAYSF